MKSRSRSDLENSTRKVQPYGIYVHIPFCVRKCPYCDFYSIEDTGQIDAFINALMCEMRTAGGDVVESNTLYFGGGTPSLIEARDIARIIDAASRYLGLDSEAEITIEANPGTITAARLSEYRMAGVNRIVAGVQSFSDKTLKMLGRIHSAMDAQKSIALMLESGFPHVALDLISGIPGQSVDDAVSDLEKALECGVDHISCYLLSIPAQSLMGRAVCRGEVEPLSDDAQAEFFIKSHRVLVSSGFVHYEISNYAKGPASYSRHNLKYWARIPYFGFGPSAHSFDGRRRWANTASVSEYIDKAGKGIRPVSESEEIGIEQELIEEIYLGLRVMWGIDMAEISRRFPSRAPHIWRRLSKWTGTGHGVVSNGRFFLTAEGMLIHETVVLDLLRFA